MKTRLQERVVNGLLNHNKAALAFCNVSATDSKAIAALLKHWQGRTQKKPRLP